MYQKKNLTPAERSAIYRANAAKRKNNNGGRRKGCVTGTPKMSIPRVSVGIFAQDADIFRRLAFARNCSMVDFFHLVANSLALQNREILEQKVRV